MRAHQVYRTNTKNQLLGELRTIKRATIRIGLLLSPIVKEVLATFGFICLFLLIIIFFGVR